MNQDAFKIVLDLYDIKVDSVKLQEFFTKIDTLKTTLEIPIIKKKTDRTDKIAIYLKTDENLIYALITPSQNTETDIKYKVSSIKTLCMPYPDTKKYLDSFALNTPMFVFNLNAVHRYEHWFSQLLDNTLLASNTEVPCGKIYQVADIANAADLLKILEIRNINHKIFSEVFQSELYYIQTLSSHKYVELFDVTNNLQQTVDDFIKAFREVITIPSSRGSGVLAPAVYNSFPPTVQWIIAAYNAALKENSDNISVNPVFTDMSLSAAMTEAAKYIPATAKLKKVQKINLTLKDINFTDIREIVAVWEDFNTRYFLTIDPALKHYNLFRIHSTDQHYRYIDPGRIIFTNNFKQLATHGHGSGINFCIEQLSPTLPKYKLNYQESFTMRVKNDKSFTQSRHTFSVITLAKFDEVYKLAASGKYVATAEDAQAKLIFNKILTKLENIYNGGADVTVNEITYSKEGIEYYGQKIEAPSLAKIVLISFYKGGFYNQNGQYTNQGLRLETIDQLNFEAYLATLAELCKKTMSNNAVDISVCGIKIKGISKGDYMYLNDYRINKGEIVDCITKAPCYTSQKGYETFLSSISKCSLRIHSKLQAGVQVQIVNTIVPYDDQGNKNYTKVILPLTRIKDTNYIKIGATTFKVKNINRLLAVESQTDLMNVILILSNPEILENVKISDVSAILKTGVEAFRTKYEKANKFLKEIETRYNLVQEHFSLDSGISISRGYKITGHLSNYVIDKETNNVYTYPEGKYVCMVDRSVIQTGVDKLISRIYALKNDKHVTTLIETLNEI